MLLKVEQQPDFPSDGWPLDCKLPEAGACVSVDFVGLRIIYWIKVIAMIYQTFNLRADQVSAICHII